MKRGPLGWYYDENDGPMSNLRSEDDDYFGRYEDYRIPRHHQTQNRALALLLLPAVVFLGYFVTYLIL